MINSLNFRLEFHETLKNSYIKLEMNGAVEEMVVIFGSLDTSDGSCSYGEGGVWYEDGNE